MNPPGDLPLSPGASSHLERMREFQDSAGTTLMPAARSYRKWLAHYFNLLIPPDAHVLEIGCGSGDLLALLATRNIAGIDISSVQVAAARERLPHGRFEVQAGENLDLDEEFDCIVISDTLNFAADVQRLLARLHRVSHPETRLLINFPSSLWRPIYSAASVAGLRADHPPSSWLGTADVRNLLALANWECIKMESRILLPVGILGLDAFLNRWLAPLLPWFCLSTFCIARPRGSPSPPLTVSVVVPARNEAGNIEAVVQRTPRMGAGTEIVFVEGHSRDETWKEIERVKAAHPELDIVALRQKGEGKGDAVRAAFDVCRGDVLMILDADLTVPPEDLPKFYDLIAGGGAEFANGVRLVYPMEREAMRFLNLCANKFFSSAFSWLLGQNVKDTLCGTKALRRTIYQRLAARRSYFGDFDPFGDFDLLFGADKLNLKIGDVPVRYQKRSYGSTNIQRAVTPALLFRMMLFAALKLKFL